MPLLDFDRGGRQITTVPFRSDYQRYLHTLAKRVHPRAIDSAKSWFHEELEAGIVTTSWVPGADWGSSGYHPLWDALQDTSMAAKFFGLVACDCVLERCAATGETWGYGKYEKDGIPIKGRTYFRCR